MSVLILFQNIRGTLTRRVLGLHFTTASNDFTVD
jgi:hypothetical protein